MTSIPSSMIPQVETATLGGALRRSVRNWDGRWWKWTPVGRKVKEPSGQNTQEKRVAGVGAAARELQGDKDVGRLQVRGRISTALNGTKGAVATSNRGNGEWVGNSGR